MTEALADAAEGLRGMTVDGASLLAMMANTAPVLIWVAGQDGLCTFFNDSWLAFTGRSLEQELGSGWSEGVHPDDRPSTMAAYREALAERQPFRMEFRLRHADGSYRWVLDTGVPRFGEGGTFVGFIGSCIDVTDRKTAEETLKRNELELERQKVLYQTLCTAQSALGDAVILIDLDTRDVLFVNEAFEELTGYDFVHFRAKVEEDPFDLCAPEDVATIRRRLAAERRGEPVPPRYELAFAHRDGHVIELEIMSKQLVMSGQRVSISVLRDVTARREAERGLRRSEAHVRAVLEAVGDAVLTVDEGGTIETASESARSLFGHERPVGMPIAAILPELGVGKRLDHSWLEPGILHESVGRTASGTLFPVELACHTDGEPREVSLVVRDISDRRATDREIHRAGETFQRRIGHELHEGVGQLLAAVALMAKDVVGELPVSSSAKGVRLAETLKEAVERVRKLARGLSPIDLGDRSAPLVLQELADGCAFSFGVPCSFEHDEAASRLDKEATKQLYFIAQEAISDAVKTGHATKIQVVLQARGERRSLLIMDDGGGDRRRASIPPESEGTPPSSVIGGLGLSSMRYRARLLGGTLTARRREPVGSIVECSWWEAAPRS